MRQKLLRYTTYENIDESGLRPLPSRGMVEEYIKAYYCAPELAVPWIREHQNVFSVAQIKSVGNFGFPTLNLGA